jgi:hypothetical protein
MDVDDMTYHENDDGNMGRAPVPKARKQKGKDVLGKDVRLEVLASMDEEAQDAYLEAERGGKRKVDENQEYVSIVRIQKVY